MIIKNIIGVLLLLLLPFTVAEQDALRVDPGILPDSPFYVIDTFLEERLVGNNPERALEYREEKIAEASVMAEEKKAEEAKIALEHASEYRQILEKEVTPDMEQQAKESSAAATEVLKEISNDLPELEEDVQDHLEEEKRVALAAEVSTKIKDLCSTLAKLDPVAYAQTCKTSEDSPQWQQQEDEELTDEQEQQAKLFFEKMTQCSNDPEHCDCKGMGVKSFEDLCIKGSTAMAGCKKGDQDACQRMEELSRTDMKDYLPEYLRKAMFTQEHQFTQAREHRAEQDYVEFGPGPCKDAGIKTVKECHKYMEEKFPKTAEGAYQVGGELRSGPPARIREFGRDCHALQDLTEKMSCLEEFYNKAHGSLEGKPEEIEQEHQGRPDRMPAMEEWQKEFAQRMQNAQTDEEREKIKKEFMAEAEKRRHESRSEHPERSQPGQRSEREHDNETDRSESPENMNEEDRQRYEAEREQHAGEQIPPERTAPPASEPPAPPESEAPSSATTEPART